MAKAKRKPHISGDPVDADLEQVRPNDWNPNECDDATMRSIERGFKEEGWLRSHALTIWRTDETGATQNLIIDGEHRWEIARKIGMAQGPMVFLDGLTRAQAMALTVKLDKRRGQFQDEPLANVLAFLRDNLGSDDLAEELGFGAEDLLQRLPSAESLADGATFAPKPPPPDPKRGNPTQGSGDPYTRVVQLYLSIDDHKAYHEIVARLGKERGLPNPSVLVMALLREASNGSA